MPRATDPHRRHAGALPGLAAAALAVALLACGGETRHRVLVLGLDGLDPRVVDLLISEGRLPHFARMRSEGGYGRLRSQRPLLSPVIWTTIATGKPPEEHGIGHFVAIDQTTGDEVPATSDMRRVKALWNIASERERRVSVVGWWATWPPEKVDGVLVSDHTAYHFLFEESATGGPAAAQTNTHPPELQREIAPLVRRPGDLRHDEVTRFVDVSAEDFAAPFDFSDDLSHFKWALAAAHTYRDIGLELWRRERPDLQLVYIEGVDSTSHLFGHLFRAEGLAGELAEQQRRYGRAVEEMYVFADDLVGTFLDAIDGDTTLVVLSDHGFELGQLHDDPSKTRDLRRVSERFHTEEGILYLYGAGVKPRSRLDRPSILDVAPTVLALLGLEPARDMPGRVLAEAFHDELGATRVASYEAGSGAGAPRVGARDDAADEARIAHLRSLGYLGGASDATEAPGAGQHRSPQGERNLAAIHFEAGRYDEAGALYRELIARGPADAALHTSLAGVLGAQERYAEAEAELERALRLEPLNPEAFHNLAVIAQRRGERDRAVELYRSALLANPGYEPSRRTLRELTGSAELRPPRTPEEKQAAGIAEAASAAARRGGYAQALSLLEQAESLAPDLPLVHQYRANVAYLMGDEPGAIAALERALALDPENILYRENLRRLREKERP
ncbi:MAG TPA: alkaline phosphatase family protein [Thermoanaerobaculia bacterium]|nr:alkaline phosphatase family protein [Thermoanaerobaculia bacterium]